MTGAALWLAQQAQGLQALPGRQRVTAVVVAVAVLLLVLELVRRRKLREEYSWLWAITAIVLIVLAMDNGLLLRLSQWIGAASAVSTLFFGALLFLLALALQFSVRLSRLTHRNRTLAQRVALLEDELARREERADADAGDDAPPRVERPLAQKGGAERDEVA